MYFQLTKWKKTVLVVEPTGYEGVRRIAGKVAQDIQEVTGSLPEVTDAFPEQPCQIILCATVGKSPLADRLLAEGILDAQRLPGKREVYQICYAELDGQTVLVICGSDKRGTIYGMFALSEYLGVSPLKDWGDVRPSFRGKVTVGADVETISKEPSVKYRGFFINDEWPCFGTWATTHFGDVNAACYDRIFELLLRLKGNYLWPAMWNSSFPLDGPGSANEELADLYGVVMGYSHHEPCLRASEEWDKVRGKKSVYGNDWNFDRNEAGLLRYWEDALKRSGKYENIITIGMRGERDSAILGREATLEDNISLLKRVILKQRELIRNIVPRQATQMLALYKEVERYFYGDETAEGLKSWQELEDVLFLLCEDNFGHLRTVPPKDMVNHPGGWGMYYHFDYHGGPISYEWMDSTPLSQTWEQMTQAWDYGIRELWIVNVGDLKFHEVPLNYFMALAYDFDTWGSTNPDSAREYLSQWAAFCFPNCADPEGIRQVYTDYVNLNHLRRPEALHAGVYHPCHFGETDRMLAAAEDLERRSERIYADLPEQAQDAYYSMIHYPVTSSVNLLRMHLYAGKNHHFAMQGKPVANRYAALTEGCIRRDRALVEDWKDFLGGKWDGMQLEAHIGFTKWNEDDSRYPVQMHVTPMPRPSLKVSRADQERVATKNYGSPMVIPVPDFCDAGCREVRLEVANGGSGSIHFRIEPVGEMPAWLSVRPSFGMVTDQVDVTLSCDRSRLPETAESCVLYVTDGDATVAVEVLGQREEQLPEGIHTPRNGVISMLAEANLASIETEQACFYRIGEYGKYGSGMKVSPSTAQFLPEEEKPGLTYGFRIPETGMYAVEVLIAPNNPVALGGSLRVLLETEEEKRVLELVNGSFCAGENSDAKWCADVLNQIHSAETALHFAEGVRKMTVSPLDPGIVLEKIVIRKVGIVLPDSYMGPPAIAYNSYWQAFVTEGASAPDA